MKLLVVTQIVDREDPILGFFYRWIEEFASHCEQVVVICLKKGVCELPGNVRVLSLGKEEGVSKLTYLVRFYSYIWNERKNYDAVFAHMNPEYLMLGAVPWRLLKKKVGMWYAHGAVGLRLRVATLLTQHVFTSTPEGFRVNSDKAHVVGQGIDTDRFFLQTSSADLHRAVTVGRIARVKNIDLLIRAVAYLQQSDASVTLDIFGTVLTEEDGRYEQELQRLIVEQKCEKVVHLRGPVSQAGLPAILRNHGLFLSAGQTGSLDKAILEAAASGCIVVSSNPGAAHFLASTSNVFRVTQSAEDFVHAVRTILHADDAQIRAWSDSLVRSVAENHALPRLCKEILTHYA